MFSQSGIKTVGGDLPNELIEKVDKVLTMFGERISEQVKMRQIRRAVVRSMLSCDYFVILDSQTLWLAAQKGTGLPSAIYLDHRQSTFPAQEIYTAAKWEFGFDNPFIVSFPETILNLNSQQQINILQAIAQSHVESEVQRVNAEMNTIQINPIFGPASYQIDNRLAFVLMPFTPELTEVYKSIVKPTVENGNFNLVCKRADDIKSNKAIIQDIWKSICEARLIIADMSKLNPNVMYELGIAHTLGKETILLYQRSAEEIKFPFDLTHIRRIEYENTATGGRALESELRQTLQSVLQTHIHA